jgi:hypothetical protein
MKKFADVFRKLRKKIEPIDRLASFISIKKTKKFCKKHRIYLGIAGAIIAILVIILASVLSTVDRLVIEELDVFKISEDRAPRHPLTGERIDQAYENLPQVFGVMVENAADAWPLTGVNEAFLVIEAPVEGSIPRLITFFSEEFEVEKLGPVRSARPYYIDWNDELDAVYAHVGGSPEALDSIKYDYDTIDLNQFWQSEYFYRQNSGRYAPHNVFTTSDLLIGSLDELDLGEPQYELWKFKDGEPSGDHKSLKVDWTGGSTYDVIWQYEAETNLYTRKQGGSIMYMEDGSIIEINNIVVLATDIRTIDAVDRKRVTTVGEGDALIAQDGESFLVRWKKDERDGRLKFYTHAGDEIAFNAGKTWIEVVSSLSQAQILD